MEARKSIDEASVIIEVRKSTDETGVIIEAARSTREAGVCHGRLTRKTRSRRCEQNVIMEAREIGK